MKKFGLNKKNSFEKKYWQLGWGALLVITSLMVASCGGFTDVPPLRQTCEELGKQCGTWSDGQGGEVTCPECQGVALCNAQGQCVTQCSPMSCEEMNKQCGFWDDGCGTVIDCDTCPFDDQICDANGQCKGTSQIVQEDSVSDCGGFGEGGGLLSNPPENYCDAEVLYWQYETETQTLKLADKRILLNCCGDHSMIMEKVDDVYVITERDAPEDGWGRCNCMCVFDYTMQAQGIPAGIITIKIMREVINDQTITLEVWEGDLNLDEGSGFVIIDETDVGMWCGQE